MTEAASHPPFPAPWTNKGEAYWLLLHGVNDLPAGAYGSLEETALQPSHGKLTGGSVAASVQIVRFHDSPVGPYDEIVYVPGNFSTPIENRSHLRVTRIYVSTEASIYNGRRNWNMAKHLARFNFEYSNPESRNASSWVKITVRPPTPDSAPFFSAVFTTVPYLPTLPFSTGLLPANLLLVQPPLPASPTDAAVVGTSDWKTTMPSAKGTVRLAKVKPKGDIVDAEGKLQYGDGVGFPKVEAWSLGVRWLDNMVLEFPTPGHLDTKYLGRFPE